jgi:hypothetical protein
MTRVDLILLETLDEMGNIAPSKFQLLTYAGVGYDNGLNRINQMAAQGILEIHHGKHGAHVIVRRNHGT